MLSYHSIIGSLKGGGPIPGRICLRLLINRETGEYIDVVVAVESDEFEALIVFVLYAMRYLSQRSVGNFTSVSEHRHQLTFFSPPQRMAPVLQGPSYYRMYASLLKLSHQLESYGLLKSAFDGHLNAAKHCKVSMQNVLIEWDFPSCRFVDMVMRYLRRLSASPGQSFVLTTALCHGLEQLKWALQQCVSDRETASGLNREPMVNAEVVTTELDEVEAMPVATVDANVVANVVASEVVPLTQPVPKPIAVPKPVLNEEVPDDLKCPITLMPIVDPVSCTPKGHPYERAALMQHFATNGQFDPCTRESATTVYERPDIAEKVREMPQIQCSY